MLCSVWCTIRNKIVLNQRLIILETNYCHNTCTCEGCTCMHVSPGPTMGAALWQWCKETLNTGAHTPTRRFSRAQVYSCFWQLHASTAGFVWTNQLMAHWEFFFFCQGGRAGQKQVTEKETEIRPLTTVTWICGLHVKQWEPCHTGSANGRQRNGATYDINAGMGWALPAWGSFPMSRQTAWAHSDSSCTISFLHTDLEINHELWILFTSPWHAY